MKSATVQATTSRNERRRQAKLAKKGRSPATRLKYSVDIDRAHKHHGAGQLEEAEVYYKRALSNSLGKEQFAITASNLGATLRDLGKPKEAILWYQRAIAENSKYSLAYNNLGTAFRDLGQLADAANAYRQAIDCDPGSADAYSNLGAVLNEQGDATEAMDCFQKALSLNPNHVGSHFNLGNLLRAEEAFDEAIAAYRRAISANPKFPDAHDNLGTALQAQGRYELAAASYRQAIALNPNVANTYDNLGAALQEMGKMDDAYACFLQALSIDPNVAGNHWNLALTQLALGKIEAGWKDYEWRWRFDDFPSPRRNFPQALWEGCDLAGKSILVWGEQGLGDEILFASMIPDVIAASGHCAIECEPRLVDLFARSFPLAEIHPRPFEAAETGKAAFDYQIPMGNLPRYLRPSLESFSAHKTYMVADRKRSDVWRRRLSELGPKPKVGIAWRSKHMSAGRNIYFAAIEDLGPILTVDDVTFVNLQYDDCQAEITEAKDRFGVTLHSWDDIDLMNDLDEAAALTSNLDLVVTAYTSVANMAGALGVPVFSFVPNKRYWISMGAEHVPWYPDTRFFKKTGPGDWQGAFENIADAIRRKHV